MSEFLVPKEIRKLVRVEGREDLGEVLDEGHNFGSIRSIYCVGIHFPKDGLCAYYDKNRIKYVDAESE